MSDTYIPDWGILKAMDFGYDMPDEVPDTGHDLNFD